MAGTRALALALVVGLLCCGWRAQADVRVSSKSVQHEYIVVFHEYLSDGEQRSTVEKVVGAPGQPYQYETLPHLTQGVPSDFVVVRFNASVPYEPAILLLRESGVVRHVVPERLHEDLLQQLVDGEASRGERGRARGAEAQPGAAESADGRRLAGAAGDAARKGEHSTLVHAPYLMNADYLWDGGHTGAGVRVAIFDTGLSANHPDFRHLRVRTDWTDEDELDDVLGHGTFVAGVIAGTADACPGFAPDAELFIFRVFTRQRVSYTSWFLDAFNYCIHAGVDVLNLSIGGPDFLDQPFVEKVWELSANNIIVVSAIGNDGPVYGTLNNPADQADVIGVGGMQLDETISQFSSRGMTTWELPHGYGRVKPDLVAYAQNVAGAMLMGGCRTLSGTSVASPVVTGAVALLASTLSEERRRAVLNPASMKQVLIEGAERVHDGNIFEQGMGKLSLIRAHDLLQNYAPRVTFQPAFIDATDCPYMWPLCTQPLYHTAMPFIVNVTILNGVAVTGRILEAPRWIGAKNGEHLQVAFEYRDLLWPWSGNLGVLFEVPAASAAFAGVVEGVVRVVVRSFPTPTAGQAGDAAAAAAAAGVDSTIDLPVRLQVVRTPPRERRILWDQYHNLRYPSGYFPRDALWVKNEPFDWNADHLHTNFKELYDTLRNSGYYVEVLGHPFTCFDAANYGTLLIADPEDEFHPEEVAKLTEDVRDRGLSVLVLADWYDAEVMAKIDFFDENTQQWWRPLTGGSNVPALNDLLAPFGIAFGGVVYDGNIRIGAHVAHAASAAPVARYPGGAAAHESYLLSFMMQDQSQEVVRGAEMYAKAALVGLVQPSAASGRIATVGDSSCADSAHQDLPCFWLVLDLLDYTMRGRVAEAYAPSRLSKPFFAPSLRLPTRFPDSALPSYSKVVGRDAVCPTRTFAQWRPSEDTPPASIAWPKPALSTASFAVDGASSLHGRSDPAHPTRASDGIGVLAYVIPYGIVFLALIFVLSLFAGRRSAGDAKYGKNAPV